MTKVRKSITEIQESMSGGEPKFTTNDILTEEQVGHTLTWYSQNKDNKSASKYIADYLKKNKIKHDTDGLNKQVPTFGFLCRMKMRGAVLSDKHEIKFKQYLDTVKPESVEPVDKPVSNVISIQDRIHEKTMEIAGLIDESLDEYILGGFKKIPSPLSIMQDTIKSVHASRIIAIYKTDKEEFLQVLDGTDEQLVEGYSNYSKTEIKKIIAYHDLIISDALKITGTAKQNRKPRKRKAKSPEQLVAKVNICIEDDTYKIKSVSAKDIIGANQLWVFNIKTKKLGVYVADDSSGLSVKGSSIINFSERNSICKTLRKPETILPDVIKGGKVYLRNVMSTIKAKEKGLTGRLNSDTILLKITN